MGLSYLIDKERAAFDKLVSKEKVLSENIQGPTHLIKYEIRLLDNNPIKQRYRERNPVMQQVINEHVDKMLEEGVTELFSSPWSLFIVLARKKDGTYRICLDYGRLNAITEKGAYLLPQVNATLDKLRVAKYLITIDRKSGYWYVPLT